MEHLSFWAGLAVGVLSTLAAGAGLWYGMLRYLRGMDPVDLGRVHVDPSDPLALGDQVAAQARVRALVRESEWKLDTRGPTTHYPPYSTHHDLMPTEWPDGTVTYHDTRLPDPGVDDG